VILHGLKTCLIILSLCALLSCSSRGPRNGRLYYLDGESLELVRCAKKKDDSCIEFERVPVKQASGMFCHSEEDLKALIEALQE
jgi:hypothetical protein